MHKLRTLKAFRKQVVNKKGHFTCDDRKEYCLLVDKIQEKLKSEVLVPKKSMLKLFKTIFDNLRKSGNGRKTVELRIIQDEGKSHVVILIL